MKTHLLALLLAASGSDAADGAAWWRGPLCVSDVQLTADELHHLGPDGAARLLKDLGFNVQELAFPALPGYEGSFLRAPWTPQDYRAFITACHGQGIRVTPYLNVHGFYSELLKEHPDWAQRLPDGKPAYQAGGRWVPPCYNSPWRTFALDAIAALARDYAIDGVFLDGPAFYYPACYCEFCRDRFRNTVGGDLPKWADWKNPAWRAFLRFRAETLAGFLADIRKRLDAARPGEHLALFMNNASLGSSWDGARETRRLAPFLDMLGNERANLFNTPPPLTPLWLVGAAVKILETQAQPRGQPTLQYCCFRHLPWDYYGLPAAEYRIHLAGVLANGAHPQVMGGLRYLDASLQAVVRDLNRLQCAHPDIFCGSRSAANVALLWPQLTADFGGTQTPMLATTHAKIYARPPNTPPPTAPGSTVVEEEFFGWAELLFREAIPYDVLDEAALDAGVEAMGRYKTIILPAAQCLAETTCKALDEFVRRGGHLIATGTSSLCDESDAPRAGFRLADCFGAAYDGRLIGPLPFDYIEIGAKSGALLKGITHEIIPAPPSAVAVRATTATAQAFHLRKLPTRYQPIERDDHPVPAVLLNRHGEGACVYLPGAFGSAYWQHHLPDHRLLLRNAVHLGGDAPVALGGGDSALPDSIEVSWRQAADGRWLLHLVNHTGSMSRPIERVLPARDLVISLPALAKSGMIRAKAIVCGAGLAVERRGGIPTLRLPSLGAYEVIVISSKH